jgi:vacuolar-type H+-ATPase subunit E/Vma4
MPQDLKLYYTAPSDEIFEELKAKVIELRIELDPKYHHEKTAELKRIENHEDNFLWIFATLDSRNQRRILNKITQKTKEALKERVPSYFQQLEIEI